MNKGKLLHVGCGGGTLPEYLREYEEVRLDIDEEVAPDIVASMTNLGEIGKYDVVLCQHALEHLHEYDVDVALKEFYRVLNKDGGVVTFVPDLEGVEPTDEVILDTPSGGMSGLDLLYGFREATIVNHHMRHLTGFISKTLKDKLIKAGFKKVKILRLGDYNLMGVGVK